MRFVAPHQFRETRSGNCCRHKKIQRAGVEDKKSDVFITFSKVLIIFFKIVIKHNMTHVVIISGLECDLYRNKTLFFLLFSCFVLDSVF
jgi:hypothetical protein